MPFTYMYVGTGQFADFYRKVKKDSHFKELDFSAQSAQSLSLSQSQALPRFHMLLNILHFMP